MLTKYKNTRSDLCRPCMLSAWQMSPSACHQTTRPALQGAWPLTSRWLHLIQPLAVMSSAGQRSVSSAYCLSSVPCLASWTDWHLRLHRIWRSTLCSSLMAIIMSRSAGLTLMLPNPLRISVQDCQRCCYTVMTGSSQPCLCKSQVHSLISYALSSSHHGQQSVSRSAGCKCHRRFTS